MVKNNESFTNKHPLLSIFGIIMVVSSFICMFLLAYAVRDIKTQLKDIPKRVCHIIKQSNDFITLEPYSSMMMMRHDCTDRNVYCFNEDDEYICEEGDIEVYTYSRHIVNWDSEPKICLIKIKQKICEIK